MFIKNFKSTLPIMIVATGMALMVLSGCSIKTISWRHNTIAQEEWGVDGAQCKWEAQQKAEENYFSTSTPAQQGNLEDPQGVDTMFASSSVNSRANQLYNQCMRNLGYVEAE